MDTMLKVLRAVQKGPCHEFDGQPFFSLRDAKERGFLEPYQRIMVPHYGPSTHWILSMSGRAELKRLESETPLTGEDA
jgi:hypothetical protein